MTGIFDGMAGVLNQVFGAPVTHLPVGGVPRTIRAVFREDPVEVLGDDGGQVLAMMPRLSVRKGDAATIAAKDRVEPGNGKTYRVLNRQPGGSPASDGFVAFDLQEQS